MCNANVSPANLVIEKAAVFAQSNRQMHSIMCTYMTEIFRIFVLFFGVFAVGQIKYRFHYFSITIAK